MTTRALFLCVALGAALAAGSASAQNSFEGSPHNWDNSPYNWRNSAYNWRNSQYNWDASPYNWQNTNGNVVNRQTGPNAILDREGMSSGGAYAVRGPSGSLLRFDTEGKRLPLDVTGAQQAETKADGNDQGTQ